MEELMNISEAVALSDKINNQPKKMENEQEKLIICVKTTNLHNGKVSTREIDHNNREQRQWLGKHCFWCFRNNHKVETQPKKSSVD